MNPALLAARSYPTARAEGLQLGADTAAWLFLFDDQGDEGPYGRDPELWLARAAHVEALIEGKLPPEAVVSPAARALDDLLRRACVGMSDAWSARFRHNFLQYARTSVSEASRRAAAVPLDVLGFIAHRRESGAMNIVFDLAEPIEGTEIPSEWYRLREFQHPRLAANDVVCWHNDIVSLRKELAHADVHNLPLVLQRAIGCDLQEAVDRAAVMTQARIGDFITGRDLMLQLLDATDLDAGTRLGIRRCLEVYGAWMNANAVWSFETRRYTDVSSGRPGVTVPAYIEPLLRPD
ncbi:hypothetical protein [Streptomyces sp. MZ04]|uniref:terpene synthase family protein n=1 Tax=Streptomyces sp. MZ04 TaxID=2559236 RepID=UPI00107E6715|nr:hypothetical protein [Streptomyces sp. MZ04]TGB13314.1 hypothetical protein E2651_09895 [Streptomyces sp. MZ04]